MGITPPSRYASHAIPTCSYFLRAIPKAARFPDEEAESQMAHSIWL